MFKFNGIPAAACCVAVNSAGEMPSLDKLIVCAFVKPFELTVRPFGNDFFNDAVGVNADIDCSVIEIFIYFLTI